MVRWETYVYLSHMTHLFQTWFDPRDTVPRESLFSSLRPKTRNVCVCVCVRLHTFARCVSGGKEGYILATKNTRTSKGN